MKNANNSGKAFTKAVGTVFTLLILFVGYVFWDGSRTFADRNPFFIVVQSGNVEEVLKSIEEGADVNQKAKYFWLQGHWGSIHFDRPLHRAAVHRLPEIVHILLENNADVNILDMQRRTPLGSTIYAASDLQYSNELHKDDLDIYYKIAAMLVESGGTLNFERYMSSPESVAEITLMRASATEYPPLIELVKSQIKKRGITIEIDTK